MKKILLSTILCMLGLLATETNNQTEPNKNVKELFEKTSIKKEEQNANIPKIGNVEDSRITPNNSNEQKIEQNIEQSLIEEQNRRKAMMDNERFTNRDKSNVEPKINSLKEIIKTKEENLKNLNTEIEKEQDIEKKRSIAEKIKKEQDMIKTIKMDLENTEKIKADLTKPVVNQNNIQSTGNNKEIESQIQALQKSIEEMKKSSNSYENLERVMLKGDKLVGQDNNTDGNNLEIEKKSDEDIKKEKEDKENKEKELLPEPNKIASFGSQKILFASFKEESYNITETSSETIYKTKIIKIKEGFTKGEWVLTKINMDYILYTNKKTNEEIYKFLDQTPTVSTASTTVPKKAPAAKAPVKKVEEKKKIEQKKIDPNSNRNKNNNNNNNNYSSNNKNNYRN